MYCIATIAVSALVLYAAFLKYAVDGAAAFEEPDLDAIVGRAEAAGAHGPDRSFPDAGVDRAPARSEAA